MAVKPVQSGWSQIQFSSVELSQGLLAVGVGILTYEIVSKTVHKIANETFSKIWLLSLAASAAVTITVGKMELPTLQGRFIALCIVYVVVSIWVGNSKEITASWLPDYMVNMVEEARKGAYHEKIGYEKALKSVEVFMNNKTIANALLLAYPGVGKSTIPETIAYKIATGQYSSRSVFFNAQLIRIDFTDLLAGTFYRGALEQRVKDMINLAKKDPKVIFWIDEIQNLVGGGQTIHSHIDVKSLLFPAMARGDIRILGATTVEDYDRYIKPNWALASRLPTVTIYEPSPSQCFEMLKHSCAQNTAQGRIKISPGAIAAAIFFSKNIPHRFFPRKAVKLIEDAASHAELMLDETENEIILDEHHVAEAYSSEEMKADALVLLYRNFIAQHPLFFPGLVSVPDN